MAIWICSIPGRKAPLASVMLRKGKRWPDPQHQHADVNYRSSMEDHPAAGIDLFSVTRINQRKAEQAKKQQQQEQQLKQKKQEQHQRDQHKLQPEKYPEKPHHVRHQKRKKAEERQHQHHFQSDQSQQQTWVNH